MAIGIERSRMNRNRTYLGGALQRIPVDGDGIVRHFLDAANEANRVLRICVGRKKSKTRRSRWSVEEGIAGAENMFVLTIKEISALPTSDKCLMSYV